MSETIRVPNFDRLNLKEITLLDADALAGQNQVTIVNQTSYAIGNFLLIGPMAQETSEVAVIQNISNNVITLTSNLQNNHLRFETLTQLFGNQVRLYRAPNVDGSIPPDTAFSYLNAYATIEGDNISSDLTDMNGGSSYWYKTTYYNTGTGEETSLSLSIAVRGGNYGKLVSLDAIRLEAGLTDNHNIDDSKIAERRDQAENEVLGRLAAVGYTIPLQSSNGTVFVPSVVENAARLLAAGYVLLQDYGSTTEESTKNGKDKVKQAHLLLDGIQNQSIVLLDITGSQLNRTLQVAGWPDSTTAITGTDGVNGEPFQITMSKRF